MKAPGLLVVFFMLAVSAVAAEPTSEYELASRLFALINQRLSYMDDVARYKMHKQLAVEDRSREAVVLQKAAIDARKAGLSPPSVEHFFRLQIAAAKAIQYRVRARSVFQASLFQDSALAVGVLPDLNKDIRPALLALSADINAALYAFLAAGYDFDASLQPVFLRVLDVGLLEDVEKRALYDALGDVALHRGQTNSDNRR